MIINFPYEDKTEFCIYDNTYLIMIIIHNRYTIYACHLPMSRWILKPPDIISLNIQTHPSPFYIHLLQTLAGTSSYLQLLNLQHTAYESFMTATLWKHSRHSQAHAYSIRASSQAKKVVYPHCYYSSSWFNLTERAGGKGVRLVLDRSSSVICVAVVVWHDGGLPSR